MKKLAPKESNLADLSIRPQTALAPGQQPITPLQLNLNIKSYYSCLLKDINTKRLSGDDKQGEEICVNKIQNGEQDCKDEG